MAGKKLQPGAGREKGSYEWKKSEVSLWKNIQKIGEGVPKVWGAHPTSLGAIPAERANHGKATIPKTLPGGGRGTPEQGIQLDFSWWLVTSPGTAGPAAPHQPLG